MVDLALGLGKTIVDGGKSWNYSPAYPNAMPPYKNLNDMIKQTQSDFWAVNMGKPPAYDPVHETEYLAKGDISDAEKDGVLTFIASTYEAYNERLVIGTGSYGPRVLTFAPILEFNDIPLNNLVKTILKLCEDVVGHQVEIEFAMTLDPEHGLPARFGLLQVRPMFVSRAKIELSPEEMSGPNILVASEDVLGNGIMNTIKDVVYLKARVFNEKESWIIASELETINHQLVAEGKPYLLIVFGRLGTTDPPFGIPAQWWQISGAKVIVESALPEMNVELSQGSHFFHNVISSQVGYFSMPRTSKYKINWDWFGGQTQMTETNFVRHLKLDAPLIVKIDGTNARGVIYHG